MYDPLKDVSPGQRVEKRRRRAFIMQAGKRLAQRVAGIEIPNLPFYSKHLAKFPFAKFRAVGQ